MDPSAARPKRTRLLAWAIGALAVLAAATAAAILLTALPPPPAVVWYCAASLEIRTAPGGERIDGYALYPIRAVAGATRRGLVARPPTLSKRFEDWTRGGHEIDGWIMTATGETQLVGDAAWERCLLEPIRR